MWAKQVVKKTVFKINRNPISRSLLAREFKKRAKLNLTKITELSDKISMFSPFTEEIHEPNDWYGHANNLKVFLGLPRNYQFKFIMEHGLYLNDQVDQIDLETNLPTFITYSDYRKGVLRKYKKNVFSIGPFIHYAQNFLNEEEIKAEKKRLGRSVLFFPAHSSSVMDFNYDVKKLCKQIKKIAKDFKQIRVCLYWKDVLLDRQKIYQDFGFECVTAGHMLDPLFLPRLKSLIEISDLTISNIVSSQAGFCIHLKKPHIIIGEKLKMKATGYWKRRISQVFESEGYTEMLSEFSKINYKITKKQKELTNKYWGSDLVKTKSQLKKIIEKTEKIYLETRR